MAGNSRNNNVHLLSKREALPSLILRALTLFVILEPLWMLLPFAGFIYGSVMHIEAMSRNPYTARLVHFVLPTHTLFPLGLFMIFAGLVIFLVGALQIYTGKIAGKGLIKTGLYRKFRHPQYLALSLFGLGVILTWGRLITFIAYFIMMWLYYFLAQHEESRCLKIFGEEYEEYQATTYLLFPGEKLLFGKSRHLIPIKISPGAKLFVSFFLVITLATVSGLMITGFRARFRDTIPIIRTDYHLPSPMHAKIPLIVVKGPALQAAPLEKLRTSFMEKVVEMILASNKIESAFEESDLPDSPTLLAFPTPGRDWYKNIGRDHQEAAVDLFILCLESQAEYTGNNFSEFRRAWRISRLMRVENMVYERLQTKLDPVEGKVSTEEFKPRMEERIDFFLSGL